MNQMFFQVWDHTRATQRPTPIRKSTPVRICRGMGTMIGAPEAVISWGKKKTLEISARVAGSETRWWKDFKGSPEFKSWWIHGSHPETYESAWRNFSHRWLKQRTIGQFKDIKKALREIAEIEREPWLKELPRGEPWKQFGDWEGLSEQQRYRMGLQRIDWEGEGYWLGHPIRYAIEERNDPLLAAEDLLPFFKVRRPQHPNLRKCSHGVYFVAGKKKRYCSLCNPMMCIASVSPSELRRWDEEEDKPEGEKRLPKFDPSGELDLVSDTTSEDSSAQIHSLGVSSKAYFAQLRRFVGSKATGFQVRAPRGPERTQKPPAWVLDTSKILTYYAHLQVNRSGLDGVNAADSIMCLIMYYQWNMTAPEIASDTGMNLRKIESLISNRTRRGDIFFKNIARAHQRPDFKP